MVLKQCDRFSYELTRTIKSHDSKIFDLVEKQSF